MFTGIVQEIGTVRELASAASGARLEVASSLVLERLAVDDSVNVHGVCLTVTQRDARSFSADVVPETLARTTLGRLHLGSSVNLEPAVAAGSSLGGHIVQGHVDGTASVESVERLGEGARLRLRVPSGLGRYLVEKGFVALDGVSLTVAALQGDLFDVALIPHTAQRTTLGMLREGDLVNVEVDIIGKYVERLLEARTR
jgi:riboflavin synthase